MTYASDCTTLQSDFNLGDVVCAKATGVPVTVFSWHVAWVDTVGFIRQSDIAIADDAATYSYTLPSTTTSVVNGQTVNNTGTWRVNLTRFSGAILQTARFTVHEPANPKADVFVQKFARDLDASVPAGVDIPFVLVVGNNGPDSAGVHLVDSVPSGGTLVSFTQQSGPACLPALANDCTITSLANGERAEFTAIYGTAGISPGTVETTARVTGSIADPDDSNNNSFAQFQVTTGSGTPTCTLTCPTSPAPFNNDSGTGGHIIPSANFPVPVATGATCGAVSTSAVPNPQGNYFFPIGISVITASTESGEECFFTITVKDVEAPTINCSANIARFESSPGSGSATVNFTVTATDNSGTPADPAGSATVSCNHNSGDLFLLGATPVHCTATDDGNNTASCDFTVTINADSGCVLTAPAPIVVNSDANACGTHVTLPTVTGNAQCVAPITCDHASGSFFGVGETLVTCSDTTGGTTSFTVNVEDHTAPVPNLTPLPTITADCSASAGVPTTIQTPTGPKVIFEAPTATDNCGLISGTTTDPITYQIPGTYVVHWVYDDGNGNTTNQNQTIVVTTDTSPPVPDVASLPALTGECSATVTTVPTATDACTGTVTGTTTDPLTYTTQGDFTITWHYDDGNGHVSTQTQQIHVHDVTPPTISPAPPDVDRSTGAGNTTCTVLVTNAELGTAPTATDNCSVTVTRSGVPAGNQFPVGTTNVVYTATDAGGNVRTVTQHVTVHDTTPPTITAPANASYQCVSDVPAASPSQATASDNCGTPTVTVSESNNGGVGSILNPLVITRTFTATDAGVPANTASAVQTITVTDTIPPTITCPANITLEPTCPGGAKATWTAPVGTDNCPGATTTQTGGPASGSLFPIGNTTVTYSVTDAHGNGPVSCSFTVRVKTAAQTVQDMKTAVQALQPPLTGTQVQGLNSKLQAALDAINQNKTNVACNKLADFINQVTAYINNGTLTSAQGQPLINSANKVRNTIGCTNNPCT